MGEIEGSSDVRVVRLCAKCGTVDIRYKDGSCRKCTIDRNRAWHKKRLAEPDGKVFQAQKTRRARLTKYGLTDEQFARLMDEQCGLCAICGTPDPTHIDHDHETMVVRGVLCLACNVGLGSFRDSVGNLEAAIDYLSGGNNGGST